MAAASVLDSAVALLSTIVNGIVVAAIILFIGIISGRLLGKLAERLFAEIGINNTVYSHTRMRIPADEIFGAMVQYFIYFFSIILALDALNLQAIFFSIFSILIAAIIFISFLLSLKDFIPNVFAGVFLHQKGIAHPGDMIKVSDVEGRVISIDLVDTRVSTKSGDVLFVPNTFMLKNSVLVRRKRKS